MVARSAALAAAILTATLPSWAALPGEAASVEYAVKAAYLYKFGAFVEWPATAFAEPGTPATVCVGGRDPFGPALDKAVQGQRIGERPIVVRRPQTASESAGCQILYIGDTGADVAAWINATRGMGVLTVTDAAGAPGASGIINFVISNNRVRFEIDNQAAAANGLAISSKLLSLATVVKPAG